jgi:AcrR family transcriptional regulator
MRGNTEVVLDGEDARLIDAAWHEFEPAVARRVLVAAVLEFAVRGYHATTTRDIASRAGLSPAGVYVHFRSKEELLHQSTLIGHRQTVQKITEAAATSDEPFARLRAVVGQFAEFHAVYHTAGRVAQYELAALTEPHFAEVAVLRREIDRVMRETLEHGVRAGVFDVPDVGGTALALLSLSIDVSRWYQPGGRRGPAEIAELYADLAVRMVRR